MSSNGQPASFSKWCTAAFVVQYPRFTELHRLIQECVEITAEIGEPQCMCLEGPPGVGKSTLVQTYADTFWRYDTASGTKIPVFYMETPHPVTVKGMAAAMLDTLGDPRPHQGTLAAMNSRLVNFIRDCEVGLVILDDFHHLIDKQTNRVLRDVSEWLKVQIKLTGIPYLVVGIEGEVERILKANSQLSRLFIREKLKPFAWDTTRPETIESYAALIAYVEHRLQMKFSEEVERPELLFRLHYATGGVMNNLMNLLIQARRVHRQQHPENTSVSLATLAKVYEGRVKAHIGRSNPFLITGKFVPPLASLPENAAAPTRRSAGQVLKTR